MTVKKTKSSTPKKPVIKLKAWHYLLLIIIPAAVYARTVTFGYVMHDDDKMIPENPMLDHGFDPSIAFTTDAWFMDARIELYRPWQSITYMLDHAISGDAPAVYHVHNLIIFIIGVVLLFFFLRYYFKPVLAWAGTMLYSVNLLTPHVVGWIAARGDLYLMVFGLLFLICIQRYLSSGKNQYLWASPLLFLMALFSKESAVALLPVAWVMQYVHKRRIPGGISWVWLGINIALFVIYFAMRNSSIADASNLSAHAFISNLRSLPEEFFKMIIPLGFSVMPGYSVLWTIGGFILLGALAYLVWKNKPDYAVVATGLVLWLALLLPSMIYEPSFAHVSYDYLDHRTWLPFVGIWMIVLAIVDKLKLTSRKEMFFVFIALMVVWIGINFWRSGTYEAWMPYYTNAINSNPKSGLANLNYGSMLRDEGKWDEALPFVEKGVELSPGYTDAKVRLAEVYFNLKRYPDAIDISNKALAEDPNNLQALQFRGSALGASGHTKEAAEDFKTILNADPNNLHGLFNLGVAYKEANQMNEAIETFSLLISKKPDFPNAYYERGFSYGKMGLFAQAKVDMDRSIEYQPEHGASYFFRGRAMEGVGKLESACQDWVKAAQLGVEEATLYVQQKCSAGN